MNRNWVRFICFSLIFLLLFSWGNFAMKDAGLGWTEFYQLPENSVDVVILGNSHNFQTFQPQIINDIVPVNSYTLGISGENIFISYYELREILKYQKPKTIVLETFTLDLTDMKMPAYIFSFLDFGVWDFNKAAIAARFLPLDQLQSVVPILRTRIDWNNPGQFVKILADSFKPKKDTINPQDLGYLPLQYIIPADIYQSAKTLSAPSHHLSLAENEKYLLKFIELCNKEDIQLVFATSPVVKISGDQFKYYQPFELSTFADEHHLTRVTFDQTRLNRLHYYNLSHVNTLGSVITSIDLALAISKELNLPVDQEKLQYFQSFIFTDYDLTQSGNRYNVKLLPENADAPLDYRFTVIGAEGQGVVDRSDWQRNNGYEFSLTEPGEYCIEIEIRNPSGDYSLKIIFRIYYDGT